MRIEFQYEGHFGKSRLLLRQTNLYAQSNPNPTNVIDSIWLA